MSWSTARPVLAILTAALSAGVSAAPGVFATAARAGSGVPRGTPAHEPGLASAPSMKSGSTSRAGSASWAGSASRSGSAGPASALTSWAGSTSASVIPAATPGAGPVRAATVRAVRVAAPNCATPPQPARPVAATPWPQQRYAPERLAPLATGAGVTVAVVDSGVDRSHPQLDGRVLDGTDLLDSGGDGSRDCAGHGTGVASIIAAAPRPGVAFHGLAPGARILPVRVSEQQVVEGRESGRTVSAGGFARAIRWAVDHGADVLNLSVVLYADDPAVRSAIAYAVGRDVVVVAAAGNLHDGGDPRPYPAAYDGVLGVGAIAADGTRAPFSQIGPYLDLVAPGSDVLMAAPGQGHHRAEGTSYAAPFVAATAALLREYRPELSAAQVAERIIATADPAPDARRGGGYGAGVLNPYRAVTETGGGTGETRPVAALAEESPDPARVAQRARREAAEERALLLATIGGAAAGVVVLLALVLPRGARRGWRPAEPA